MRLAVQIILLISGFSLPPRLGSQEYIWPTNASYYLTSSFGEFRYGHFHAGIDVKTWGKTGYPVYAIRPGYIWRMRVSPYGYGRVLYQKLDTGEIVVYAHLERFAHRFEAVMHQEQMRRQDFSINKYFDPHDFPVEAGEIIAYTGESGIGPAHLHFEIRDPYNNPINPLSKGFPVTDTRPPQITHLALLPLRASTQISGDFQTLILTPVKKTSNQFIIGELIQVYGEVGLAIKVHDPINDVTNKLGIYELRLFIDDRLIFAAKYDKFSYATTNQIFLDRDFRLLRRGLGTYYRCFRDYPNELNFYKPFQPGAGIINEQLVNRLRHEENIQSKITTSQVNGSINADDEVVSETTPHNFRIEVNDYHGNTSILTGQLVFHKWHNLEPEIEVDQQGRFYLTNLSAQNLNQINQLKAYISYNQGRDWVHKFNLNSKQLASSGPEPFKKHFLTNISNSPTSSRILKLEARDQHGLPFKSYFQILQPNLTLTNRQVFIDLKHEFFDNFIYFQVNVSIPVEENPILLMKPDDSLPIPVELIQNDLFTFIGCYELTSNQKGRILIEVSAETIDGRGMFYEEQFNIQPIPEATGGRLQSNDGRLWVNFSVDGIYRPLFGRIYEELPETMADDEIVGQIYRIEPFDVPLKKNAKITIQFPEHYPSPEKLGIYARASMSTKNKWRFSGNTLDLRKKTITTHVNSFDSYTLIKDEVPPEITSIYPSNGMRLSNTTPRIQVKIADELSGFIGNSQYLRMYLDDKLVIAEYDPDRKILGYQPATDLMKGKHILKITAKDRCGNLAEYVLTFWII